MGHLPSRDRGRDDRPASAGTGGGAAGPGMPPATRSRWLWGAFAVAVVVVLVAGASGNGNRGGSDDLASASVAEKLAAVVGDDRSPDAVRPYRIGLNAAEPVCTEGRDRIADIVYTGRVEAENVGVDATALELLRAIPGAVPRDAPPTSCADVVASLVVLMRP